MANDMRRKHAHRNIVLRGPGKKREDMTMINYEEPLKWVVEKQAKRSRWGSWRHFSIITIEFDTSQAEALWRMKWKNEAMSHTFTKDLKRRGKRVTMIDYGNNSVLGGVEATLKNPKM